jgi:hypothetical protein
MTLSIGWDTLDTRGRRGNASTGQRGFFVSAAQCQARELAVPGTHAHILKFLKRLQEVFSRTGRGR